MSLNSHDDRFDHEGEARVSFGERQDAYNLVQLVAEIRERLLLEARTGAEQIRQACPNLIDRYEHSTRSKSATFEEQIQGFVECVSDNFGDLIDSDELRSLQRIADTGRDDD